MTVVDWSVTVVDLGETLFDVRVKSQPGIDTIYTVSCKLTEPRDLPIQSMPVVQEVLDQYFNRVESSVPAGVGVLVEDNTQRLREMLVADPPNLPGIQVELVTVSSIDLDRLSKILANNPYFSEKSDSAALLTDVSAVIWTSGSREEGHGIRSALEEFLVEYGIFETERGAEQAGSWWQRLKFRLQRAFNTEVVQRHLAEAEYRLQLELVEKAAAEVNQIKSDSAAKLIAAVDKSEKAVVIFGQTVIVKFNNTIIVRSVDPLTAAKIERTDALLSDPEAVVAMLSRVSQEAIAAGANAGGAPPPTELEAGD